MNLSVVVCTRDRATSLRRMLTSMVALEVPSDLRWEILVIDNGGGVETSDVVASFKERLPIAMIAESRPGLSSARNCGLAAARGDYIVWTDDDVEVDAHWLAAYDGAFRRFPDAVVFGGKIVPVFESPPPQWFTANVSLLGSSVAARDFGNAYRQLTIAGDVIPFGANFAIRAAVQRRACYDTSLGAGSGAVGVGEETAVIKALLAAGAVGYWVPAAIVRHHIPQSRLTHRMVARWFEAVGFSMQHENPDPSPRLFGIPRWMWRDLAQRQASYWFKRATRPPAIWIVDLTRLSVARGQMAYWLRQRGLRAMVKPTPEPS